MRGAPTIVPEVGAGGLLSLPRFHFRVPPRQKSSLDSQWCKSALVGLSRECARELFVTPPPGEGNRGFSESEVQKT